MMNFLKSLYYQIKRFIKGIGNNIVFIPAVIGMLGVLLAILLYFLESMGISKFLIEKTPYLVVNNYETASTLLSTFSAGVLSIMVFSFSMVMLLLNQAGNNYSPRVLPGLISVKKHQYIIGLFLGTVLYNTFVLVGLKPSTNQYQLPGFSVLLGMLWTVMCLFAFIYFIDSISKSIQVQNILSKIFDKAKSRMAEIKEKQCFNTSQFNKDKSWESIHSTQTGYLHNIDEALLLNYAQNFKTRIEVNQLEGTFVMKGEKIITSEKTLTEEQNNDLLSCLIINRNGEAVRENYLLGFKQISEIGLRAMSPGINDPATAITTIDYLTELFSIQMNLPEGNRFLKDKDDTIWVILKSMDFKDLLYQVMVEYRTYCKADMSCMQKLATMLKRLHELPQANENHKKSIEQEMQLLALDAKDGIKNPADYAILEDLMKI